MRQRNLQPIFATSGVPQAECDEVFLVIMTLWGWEEKGNVPGT